MKVINLCMDWVICRLLCEIKKEDMTMFVSHVLYRVDNLPEAVKKLKDAGFLIHVPGNLETAFHAILWFEKGPYLELIVPEKSMVFPKWLMYLTGYRLFVKRQKKWIEAPQGWCDVVLESYAQDLRIEKELIKKHSVRFKQFRPKVKNEKGQEISWWSMTVDDYYFPFMVSAYNIDPRPSSVVHPNGVTGVDKVFIGKQNLNQSLFQDLLTNESWCELVDGRGVQTVSLKGTNLKIEEIL